MMKRCKLLIVVLFSVLLVYCRSDPAPVSEEMYDVGPEGAPEASAEVAPEELNRQLGNARAAVVRAEEADAEFHDPENLREARNALTEAETWSARDPERALSAANRALEFADQAYRLAAVEQLLLEIEDWLWRLRGLSVDLYAPAEYATVEQDVQRASAMLQQESLGEARAAALDLIGRMELLYNRVEGQLTRITELEGSAMDLLDEARAADAHLLAGERFREAEASLQAGKEAMNRYDLSDAVASFQAAGAAAATALDSARMESPDLTGGDAEELMRAVMREIEAASQLSIVADDGVMVEPQPWDGAQALEMAAGGMAPDAGAGGVDQVPQHLLLERAKELWKTGVAERAAGDPATAVAYFEEARLHVQAYTGLAVLTVYTVRLIPDRRESLWRIAEYDFIYGNPWLWPKIFHRNRKLIQDPDLIFPGWELVIPPVTEEEKATRGPAGQ
jgi:nucleoid-associated protein YgaU